MTCLGVIWTFVLMVVQVVGKQFSQIRVSRKLLPQVPMAWVGAQDSDARITTVPCIPMHQALSMASLSYVDFYSLTLKAPNWQ